MRIMGWRPYFSRAIRLPSSADHRLRNIFSRSVTGGASHDAGRESL